MASSPTLEKVVVPIRFKDDDLGDTQTSVGLGVHIGVGF
jgi:hypothetical protein